MNMLRYFFPKPTPPTKRSPRLPRVVFLTGAGLSADSGIPTGRGVDGIYNQNPFEVLLTPHVLAHNPKAVHRHCDDRRVSLANVEPNSAHYAIAELGTIYGERMTHITQNVDDLVERAGYSKSVRVHGNLTSMRSLANPDIRRDIGYTRYWDGGAEFRPQDGFRFTDETGGLFRPDIVLTGEQTKLYHRMFLVMGALHPDDLLFVIGTSGTILPINRWTSHADCKKVLVNPYKSVAVDERRFDTVLRARAAESANEILDIAKRHLGQDADKSTLVA